MKILTTLGAFLFSAMVAAATPLSNIVIFGDSLSDNGNLYEYMNHQLPQSPPYYEGRFSNGPVWIEHIAKLYFPNNTQAHISNYAIGGASVLVEENNDDALFTLGSEINTYLLTHQDKASEDTLYIVWIGANNYLAMPTEVEKALKEVNEGISQSLKKLVAKGAKNILVLNLPDLGKSPFALDFGLVEGMSYFSNQHNIALAKTMDYFKQVNPEVNWLFFDMNSVFSNVMDNASDYGFTNITGTCVNSVVNEITKKSVLRMVATSTPKINNAACDGYMFFDLVHPTAFAHQIMAEKARNWLDESGVRFSEVGTS